MLPVNSFVFQLNGVFMSIVINTTPHAINLADKAGEVVRTYAPSGVVVRCSVSTEAVGELDGFPVQSSTFGEVSGLPPEMEGTIYIVSLLVAQALKGKRGDIVSPLTDATAIRKDGQVVAVRGFQRS
jgi:hypothetical protein